jgi:NAD(P)-dependent dehydrogenase (short-subunit alcohol dehydrogenase family)
VNPDAAFETIKKLHARFPDRRIMTEAVDVRDEAQIASAVESAAKVLGSVDMLCCFAGVVGCTHAIEMKADPAASPSRHPYQHIIPTGPSPRLHTIVPKRRCYH